jgi:hypothetical protein
LRGGRVERMLGRLLPKNLVKIEVLLLWWCTSGRLVCGTWWTVGGIDGNRSGRGVVDDNPLKSRGYIACVVRRDRSNTNG